MRRFSALLWVLLCLWCGLAATSSATSIIYVTPYSYAKRDTALASLKNSVSQAITMLETKDYVAFLRRFVRPQDMEHLLKECTTLEQCAEAFAEEKAGLLLQVLRKVKNGKPKMNRRENTATFTIPNIKEGKSKIIWEQVQGIWYIRN